MSSAFLALIWWVIPATALIGALGYVLWVTQFKDRYETQTARSVDQFQKFQGAFNQAQAITLDERKNSQIGQPGEKSNRVNPENNPGAQRGEEK
jgi:hypothetical protein